MLSFSRFATRAVCSTALLLSAALLSHAATITVTSTATSIGSGMYQYSYGISNSGTDDSFLIDIAVPADPAAITNLMTPSGFTSQFDSVLGLVSFLEDTSSFTAVPTLGFSFDSPDAPGTSTFTASLFDSNFDIYTISGTTTGPVVAAAAPEPAYFYLLAFFAPVFLFMKRRKAATHNQLETAHVSNS